MVGICLHVVLANQAPVVQTVDNSIHWINHYPVDSIIHPLKNRAQHGWFSPPVH